MNKTAISFFFCLLTITGFAQVSNINPVPQDLVIRQYTDLPSHFNIQQMNEDEATSHLLSTHFTNKNTSKTGFPIHVGEVNDKFQKEDRQKVPLQAEGYYIKSTDKKIVVIGRDAAGAYYGTRTLLALLDSPQLFLGEITDFPDVSARGVVEGFYGTPWNFENRMRQLDFYGANKLNTYIYGPKDDPYHSSPNWRKAYPKKEAENLKKLIARAALNHVDFVWAIHPGKDIQWNEEDRKALLQKFQWMYDLGVRAFAVFFDDISGKGTDPNQQAEILNYLNDEFITQQEGINPLIMCPTEYNKSWSKPDGGYLETLGEKLDPSIRIMWTGNTVVADIDEATMEWINSKIKRKAFIWWNYPVSDYVRNHMLLGPAYGNEKTIADDLSGFVSNPMEHAEASKIAIYGVADYSWNMTSYDPETNWQKALKNVMPTSYEALEVFATHNSDLGKNGHGYRRKESEKFAEDARLFLKDLESNHEIRNRVIIENEFKAMIAAAQELLDSEDNIVLLEEIRPWVKQFRLLGEAGISMLEMEKALQAKKPEDFEGSYREFLSKKEEMYNIDRQENQNPYQPGIKTATLVITPMIDKAFTYLTKAYNEEFVKNLEIEANYNPHKLFTNLPQLKNQQLTLDKKTLALNPPLEIIRFEPQSYVGFELQEPTKIKEIAYNLEPAENFAKLKLEVSLNGKEWNLLPAKDVNGQMQTSLNEEIKYLRLLNTSAEEVETKIEKFKINLN